MADEKQLAVLKEGVAAWNKWRRKNPTVPVDLSKALLAGAELSGADLSGADLTEAILLLTNLAHSDLTRARLTGAKLVKADLRKADLAGAKLTAADLTGAFLIGTDLKEALLSKANLTRAFLGKACLKRADLTKADLRYATLNQTNLEGADLTDAKVYGASVRNVDLRAATQKDILITDDCESRITVDNLEVAEPIHLLLDNKSLLDTPDAITVKVVLILGRFTKKRKNVLDKIRETFRFTGYASVLLDLEKTASKNLIETIRTLAHLSRFIIADLTALRMVPRELGDILPELKVPIVPIIKYRATKWAMWDSIADYPWVLEVHNYKKVEQLIDDLEKVLIPAAEAKAAEIEQSRKPKLTRKRKKNKRTDKAT